MKAKLIISTLFYFFSLMLNAQTTDLEKYNKEKEAILSTIVNSVQFDSVYNSKQVYFKANELLTQDTPICVKKGKKKVKIKSEINRQYVVVGDFTMPKINPKTARVQLEILPQEYLLNLRLEKIKEAWTITNHLIMKD